MNWITRVAGAAFVYFCTLFTALGIARLARDVVELAGIDGKPSQIFGALLVAFLLLPCAGFAVRTFDVAPTAPQRLAVGLGASGLIFAVGAVEATFFRSFFAAELHQPADRFLTYLTIGLLFYAALLPLFRERHHTG